MTGVSEQAPEPFFCLRGHDQTDPDVISFDSRGRRRCIPCHNERRRERVAENEGREVPRRGTGFCKRGHDQSDPANVRVDKTSAQRKCKACEKVVTKERAKGRLNKREIAELDALMPPPAPPPPPPRSEIIGLRWLRPDVC